MGFNECHKKRCAINAKNFMANCTCGFTEKWQKEKIKQLRAKIAKLEGELENEKYNLPCPYSPKVMCIQMPCEPKDDNYCDDGCPNANLKENTECGT